VVNLIRAGSVASPEIFFIDVLPKRLHIERQLQVDLLFLLCLFLGGLPAAHFAFLLSVHI
jgi:hypothetical protein